MTTPPHQGGLSLSARVTLLAVGVALLSALLAGLATARALNAADRELASTVVTTSSTSRAEVRQATQAAIDQLHDRPGRLRRAVLVSVGVGLAVGLVAGTATAAVTTRPLRRTAQAAAAMGAGRRDVRVPVEGPREVAEVAASLNGLADALAASEDRQRRFLLSVSHELRTPLTAVRGYAESIADAVVTGPEAVAAAEVILQESQRLERLVSDLLDLARIGADNFRLTVTASDAAETTREAAAVWAVRGAAAGVTVTAAVPPLPVPVLTDPGRLRQVIDALADNAVRMTPAGGTVVITVRPGTATDGPGARAVLTVGDSGPGLTPEDAAVAFEPGALGARYRDSRPGGVGIGLSLVHALVKRMNGSVVIGRSAQGGAEFTVTLGDAPGGEATRGA